MGPFDHQSRLEATDNESLEVQGEKEDGRLLVPDRTHLPNPGNYERCAVPRTSGSLSQTPWKVSTFILLMFLAWISVLYLKEIRRPQPWRGTDFIAARPAIRTVQRKFTTGIESYLNGSLYRSFDPEELSYVGPPSAEIDANWEALHEGILTHIQQGRRHS